MRTTPFWLVWSPSGERPPSHRHATEADAEREAERLADARPGAEFYVLAPIYHVVAQRRLTERFLVDDGIPF